MCLDQSIKVLAYGIATIMGYPVRMYEIDPQSLSYTQNALLLLWHSLYKYKKKGSEER